MSKNFQNEGKTAQKQYLDKWLWCAAPRSLVKIYNCNLVGRSIIHSENRKSIFLSVTSIRNFSGIYCNGFQFDACFRSNSRFQSCKSTMWLWKRTWKGKNFFFAGGTYCIFRPVSLFEILDKDRVCFSFSSLDYRSQVLFDCFFLQLSIFRQYKAFFVTSLTVRQKIWEKVISFHRF